MLKPKLQFRLASLLIVVSAASIAFAFLGPKPRHKLHLLRSPDFTCADIARAVNYYVDLGEEETLREFHDLARQDVDIGRPVINERIGWLCRILYEPNGKPLRAPMLGGLMLPYDQMPLDKWPLYPVAKSGDTYCVLSQGYSLSGYPEPMADYFRYCTTKGSFRTATIPIPNRTTAVRDVSAIRSSKRWSSIKWKNAAQGFSYTMNEPWIWSSIIAQAESIQE